MLGNSNADSPKPASTNDDRRVNSYIREIFEEAYVLVLPLVDPKQGWAGQPMTRHAYPALHEAFPRLDMQDLAILVPALERVFRERSKVR